MVESKNALLARSQAAIAEANRLVAQNRDWQERTDRVLKQLYFRASFHPKTLKFYLPIDFQDRRLRYQPAARSKRA